jgi:transcriptional regulator with XRE-family HTH domain
MSFSLNIAPTQRAGSRFIAKVRKAMLMAALDEKKNGVSQTSIAKALGVDKAVVSRLLRGQSNLTLRTIGEIAHVLGYEPEFKMRPIHIKGNRPNLTKPPETTVTKASRVPTESTAITNSREVKISVGR